MNHSAFLMSLPCVMCQAASSSQELSRKQCALQIFVGFCKMTCIICIYFVNLSLDKERYSMLAVLKCKVSLETAILYEFLQTSLNLRKYWYLLKEENSRLLQLTLLLGVGGILYVLVLSVRSGGCVVLCCMRHQALQQHKRCMELTIELY